jgi:CRP/FNR family transcriptional regulator, cyclic AMP receptor protein
METTAIDALLETTWFASDLSARDRSRLAALGHLIEVPPGAVLVQEGLPCATLGVVAAGRVALRLSLPGGDDPTILTIDPGDVYGWSAVLPPAIATSTAVAITASRVIAFEGEPLRAALATDRELAASVYQRLLVCVSRRLQATRLQLLDLYRPAGALW